MASMYNLFSYLHNFICFNLRTIAYPFVEIESMWFGKRFWNNSNGKEVEIEYPNIRGFMP